MPDELKLSLEPEFYTLRIVEIIETGVEGEEDYSRETVAVREWRNSELPDVILHEEEVRSKKP